MYASHIRARYFLLVLLEKTEETGNRRIRDFCGNAAYATCDLVGSRCRANIDRVGTIVQTCECTRSEFVPRA